MKWVEKDKDDRVPELLDMPYHSKIDEVVTINFVLP